MGLFLAMSGVIGAREESVVDALRAYAADNGRSLEEAELTTEDGGCLVIRGGAAGVTVLYPGDFLDWDGAAQYLSRRLGKPVFSFHIHDSDLWMYSLYDMGDTVDQFNPVPDYWGELEEDERRSLQGNASEVARRVPGLSAEQISNYLVRWGAGVFEPGQRRRAYPTDRFCYGDDWQLLDFMSKLGLTCPADDRGAVCGAAYRFRGQAGRAG
jgi:hypothetical protein